MLTPEGGSVDLAAARLGTRIVIRVTDTGEGIESSFLPHLFEPFRQADGSTTRRHGGLGLGLAIVKQLVHAHGGTIRADSDGAHRGATFTIEIPARSLPAIASRMTGEPADLGGGDTPTPTDGIPDTRLENLKILVVDDEEDARSLVDEILSESGATVQQAAGAAEAIELVSRFRPDVLVSDVGMPDIDGFEFIERGAAPSRGQGRSDARDRSDGPRPPRRPAASRVGRLSGACHEAGRSDRAHIRRGQPGGGSGAAPCPSTGVAYRTRSGVNSAAVTDRTLPPPAAPAVIPVRFPDVGATLRSARGEYRVTSVIGSGEFGAVYECVGPFDQVYAVKMVRPANRPYSDVRDEWSREVQHLLSLRHPNVVYIFDAFEDGHLFYFALERCDYALSSLLGHPMREGFVIEIARQLLRRCVVPLHDNDVFPRMTRGVPGNVLLVHARDRHGQDCPTVKLSDFGISSELRGMPSIRPNLVHHAVMAPEIIATGYTSKQSDIYQVGLLLFWMLTGESAAPPGGVPLSSNSCSLSRRRASLPARGSHR